jgi:hypothetical protein
MTKKITKTNKPASQPKPIGGKLGVIAKAIGTPKGATLEQLEKKTGWQPHTVRAALSRLRKRGMAIVSAKSMAGRLIAPRPAPTHDQGYSWSQGPGYHPALCSSAR